MSKLGCFSGYKKMRFILVQSFARSKGCCEQQLVVEVSDGAQLPRHRFGLHSICTAQLARLLEEPAVEGQPAGLEIKHTCSSLLPSGTFFAKRDHLFFNKHWAPLWEYIMQD